MNKILLIGLYNRAKKENYSLKDYEDFVEEKFNGFVPPHINDFISKSDSLDEFMKKIKKWETRYGNN
jgi:hypothetical protein